MPIYIPPEFHFVVVIAALVLFAFTFSGTIIYNAYRLSCAEDNPPAKSRPNVHNHSRVSNRPNAKNTPNTEHDPSTTHRHEQLLQKYSRNLNRAIVFNIILGVVLIIATLILTNIFYAVLTAIGCITIYLLPDMLT